MHTSHRGDALRSYVPGSLIPSSDGFLTVRAAPATTKAVSAEQGQVAMLAPLGTISAPVLPSAMQPPKSPAGPAAAKASEPCSCGIQNGDRLLTTAEAARYLRVSVQWLEKTRVYGLKRGTPPPFIRLGRFIKYRLSDLDAYIERNKARSTSEYDHTAH